MKTSNWQRDGLSDFDVLGFYLFWNAIVASFELINAFVFYFVVWRIPCHATLFCLLFPFKFYYCHKYIFNVLILSSVITLLIQGDLRAYLKRRGALKPITAVKFALDIARSITNFFITNMSVAFRDCKERNSFINYFKKFNIRYYHWFWMFSYI